MQIASVVIEYSDDKLDKTFDYLYSGEDSIIGKRVNVNFNHRDVVGYVLDTSFSSASKEELEEEYGFKLNYISSVIDDEALVNEELLDVASYMSYKYVSPLISCLQVMLPKTLKPKSVKRSSIKYLLGYKYKMEVEGLTLKQKELLEYIKVQKEVLSKDVNVAIANAFVNKGCIEKINIEQFRKANISENKDYSRELVLNTEQQEAVNKIINDDKRCNLVEGVTGSGKSEVYFTLAKHYYNKGENIILLVPEIILTSQIAARFKSYFKDELALLHSSLSEGEKYDEYRRIKNIYHFVKS